MMSGACEAKNLSLYEVSYSASIIVSAVSCGLVICSFPHRTITTPYTLRRAVGIITAIARCCQTLTIANGYSNTNTEVRQIRSHLYGKTRKHLHVGGGSDLRY